ncbi:hypothetical protein [Sediminibacillus terrae]|uniref:hypothetical protein n=1 Tax=Sediminibacillus terrae TaxID=1562106 RepID=UPI001295EC8D|nr:hypothetical protein [Sediminibacillus terrae]
MTKINRLTVAIIGAGSTLQDNIQDKLAGSYNAMGLRKLQSDLFNVNAIKSELQGADLAVFSYPVAFPAARLSQAHLPEMTVLAADSFTRAARETNLKKIIYLKPDGGIPSDSPAEVEKILQTSGIPVKTLPLPSTLFEVSKVFSDRTAGVRSIQRVRLTYGKDAEWTAFYNLNWLNRMASPLINIKWRGSSCEIHTRFLSHPLLVLQYSSDASSSNRTVFRIAGGLLAADSSGRLEFCQVPNDDCIIAIHGYRPSLPWFVYKYSQAMIHLLVMKLFKKHTERMT